MEAKLDEVEKNLIRLSAKMEGMADSINKMVNSIEKLASHGSEIKIMEERCESRSKHFDEADKSLHKRIDKIIADTNREIFEIKVSNKEAVNEVLGNQKKVMWLVITAVVLGVMKLILIV